MFSFFWVISSGCVGCFGVFFFIIIIFVFISVFIFVVIFVDICFFI